MGERVLISETWYNPLTVSLLPPKRKGPQLALEPLDGRGIAGYVPKP
jgi:hypothetical protein